MEVRTLHQMEKKAGSGIFNWTSHLGTSSTFTVCIGPLPQLLLSVTETWLLKTMSKFLSLCSFNLLELPYSVTWLTLLVLQSIKSRKKMNNLTIINKQSISSETITNFQENYVIKWSMTSNKNKISSKVFHSKLQNKKTFFSTFNPVLRRNSSWRQICGSSKSRFSFLPISVSISKMKSHSSSFVWYINLMKKSLSLIPNSLMETGRWLLSTVDQSTFSSKNITIIFTFSKK